MPDNFVNGVEPSARLIWQTGEPPGPQSATAGERWNYRLPVDCSSGTPVCRWSSDLFQEGRYAVSADTLTVSLDIPYDAAGIRKIHYMLETSPPVEGFVFLKILPSGEGHLQPPTPKQAVDPEAETLTLDPPLAPADEPTLEKAKPYPTPAGPSSDTHRSASNAERAAPEDERTPARNLYPSHPSEPPPALPSGRYFVSVYRNRVPVPQLKTEVEIHKSLLVGKFSRSKNIRPDLDLKPHFPSDEMALRCSRQQAKIYWKRGRIVLKNLGKLSVGLPGEVPLKTMENHFWQPGEEIELPGGLTLLLEKEV